MHVFIRTLRYLVAVFRNRATPWYVKALLLSAVVYAILPFDFVPDFLPPLGWLDDLILVPTLMAVAARLVPPQLAAVIREHLFSTSRR